MEAKIKRFLEAPGKQRVLYIAGGIATVLMAVVIFCNLLLIVSNIREPNQMPSVFGIRPAIVLSGSMSPTFEAGDMILLKKTKKPDELEVGDVACYLYSGKATTHRIIERFEAEGKPRYVMKGDYNNVEDRLAVDPEQIQGVWTGGRVRHLGKFLMFLQSTMGMFVFLICPLAGLLTWDILKRKKADRLRLERQEYGEGAGYRYEEGREAAGLEKIAAFCGSLGRRTEYRDRREDDRDRMDQRRVRSGEDRADPGAAEDQREAVYEEAGAADFYRRDNRSPYQEEEAVPREARRRPSPSGRERPGGFYRSAETGESERTAAARDFGRGSRAERDEEFYYYSRLDDELDYYQELEEAAEHYRRMRESLTRYRRMEAVMNRCRRLEEELSRYEALADRLEAYERTNLRRRQKSSAGNGVSNQGARCEAPVDHIERPGGTTPPTVEL